MDKLSLNVMKKHTASMDGGVNMGGLWLETTAFLVFIPAGGCLELEVRIDC